MTRRWLAAVGALAVAAGARAADPPPAAPGVDLLVARLGAERYADREAAAKALEAAGQTAIPALQTAARSSNPEVSRRATEILVRLNREAEAASRVAPKRVRLAFRDVPLGYAVNTLKGLTGINLALDPNQVADPLRPVTCETGELPAWEAVAAFCRAAGLREVFLAELPQPVVKPRRGYYTPPLPLPAADAVPVTLADGAYEPLPGSRATAVRVLALPAAFPANRVTLGTGDVVLHFDVTPVPGLHWRDVTGVRVTTLVDDAGRYGTGGPPREAPGGDPFDPLIQPWAMNPRIAMRWDNDGNPVTPTAFPNPRVVPVPLKLATPTARSLKLLEGVVVCEVVAQNQTLATVADLVRTAGTPVEGENGTRVTVLDVRDPGAGKPVVLRVQTEGPSPYLEQRRRNPWGGPLWPEPSRPPGHGYQVRASDAAGQPIPVAGYQYTDINDDGATMTTVSQVTFRPEHGVPAKLTVVGPKPAAVEIPFRMENVPLP